MKKILEVIKIILLFLVILLVVFFSIMNSEIVKLNFAFFPFDFVLEIRVFLLVIFCFCIGFISGIAATSYTLVKKYFENLKSKKRLEKLEKNLNKEENNKDNGKKDE